MKAILTLPYHLIRRWWYRRLIARATTRLDEAERASSAEQASLGRLLAALGKGRSDG